MKKEDLLGAEFDCSCGKKHRVPTKHLGYGPKSFEQLLDIATSVSKRERYVLIGDQRTLAAAGEKVLTAFGSKSNAIQTCLIPDGSYGSPVADDITKNWILSKGFDADLYIAVGSGVINDLVKWVAAEENRPYFCIPTAASMNGYGSANVAATVNGLKVLFHAEAPKALFVDPMIIETAPFELTASGLGDVLAKSVSSADWKMNKFLFGDYFCEFAVDFLKDLEPIYLEDPAAIKAKEPGAIKALFDALFYSSVAMTITGTSSPASGGEHLVSHTMDMLAGRDNTHHDLHGRQVGVATVLMAALYERIMEVDHPVFYDIQGQIDTDFWGSLSPIVEQEYNQKRDKYKHAATFLSSDNNWQKLKNILKHGLISPKKLKNCLEQGGGAHRISEIQFNGTPLKREKFVDVVTHAHQMRARFTVLDLAYLLGILPGELNELVDKWVT